MMLTNPDRFAAWCIARLRVTPPGTTNSTWLRRWQLAARIYRERAINLAQGMREEQRNVRVLQEVISELADARPLATGAELDAYVADLRDRNTVLAMYIVDLEREREALRTEVERLKDL